MWDMLRQLQSGMYVVYIDDRGGAAICVRRKYDAQGATLFISSYEDAVLLLKGALCIFENIVTCSQNWFPSYSRCTCGTSNYLVRLCTTRLLYTRQPYEYEAAC